MYGKEKNVCVCVSTWQQESVHVEAVQEEECVHPLAPQTSSQDRKQKWEQGDADYLGEDSFTHIEKKLDSFLS